MTVLLAPVVATVCGDRRRRARCARDRAALPTTTPRRPTHGTSTVSPASSCLINIWSCNVHDSVPPYVVVREGKRVAGDRSSSCAIACNDVHAVAVGSQRANTYGASVRRMPRGCCSLQPFRNECDSGDRRIVSAGGCGAGSASAPAMSSVNLSYTAASERQHPHAESTHRAELQAQ